MARRRGWASDLIEGFGSGMQMGRMVDAARERQELAAVAQAQPDEQLGTLNEGAPEAVQTQLDSGAGMGEARTLSATGRAPSTYSLLGTTQDKPFTTDQATSIRRLAQAGVLEKHGDVEGGSRLRSQVASEGEAAKRSAREDIRFNWEQGDRAKVEADRAKEEAFKADTNAAFETSNFGQKMMAYNKQVSQFQKDQADYQKKVDAGDTTAIAPTAPTRPAFSPGEQLADAATLMAVKAKHGKTSPEEFQAFSEKMQHVMDEGYLQTVRLANAGAPLTQVVSSFNAQGQNKIDPDSILSDKTVTREGGIKSRIITFKAPDGSTQVLDTQAELARLGKAGEELQRAFQIHSMANQDKQVAISGAHLNLAAQAGRREQEKFDDEKLVRQATSDIAQTRIALADTDDPEKIQELTNKLQALSTGMKGKVGMANADPAHVREAQSLVAAGAAPDMATALEAVVMKPDKMHQAYVEAGMNKLGMTGDQAVENADKTMEKMGWQRSGRMWSRAGGQTPTGTPTNEADAHTQAKAAIARGADKDAINERLKKLGFKPL